MIDNERLEKAFVMLFDIYGHNTFTESFIAEIKSIYAARDKEAEDEKRELIEALIMAHIALEYVSDYDIPLTTHETIKNAIEKHTGKPIDEVIK